MGKKTGWSLVQLDELKQFMEQNTMNWNGLAKKIGVPNSTARCWNQAGKAPSRDSQAKIRALIDGRKRWERRQDASGPPHKTPEQKGAKKTAGPGLKATSRATFTTPVEIKSKRYERKSAEGAWQVTRLSPKVAAKRMQEALAQTQVIVSTWLDLPPQKTPIRMVEDGKVHQAVQMLGDDAFRLARALATSYAKAHGSKADPKVMVWLVNEMLALVFGEQPAEGA